jgi:methionine-rich copper-binding protein CopC
MMQHKSLMKYACLFFVLCMWSMGMMMTLSSSSSHSMNTIVEPATMTELNVENAILSESSTNLVRRRLIEVEVVKPAEQEQQQQYQVEVEEQQQQPKVKYTSGILNWSAQSRR